MGNPPLEKNYGGMMEELPYEELFLMNEKKPFYKLLKKGKYATIPLISGLSLGSVFVLADLGDARAQAHEEFNSKSKPASEESIKVAQNNNGLKIYVGNFEQKNIKYPWGKSSETRDICDAVKMEVERGLQDYFMLVSKPELADVVVSGICTVGNRAGDWIVSVKLKYGINGSGEILHSNADNWFSVDIIDPAIITYKPEKQDIGRKHWKNMSKEYANELIDFSGKN